MSKGITVRDSAVAMDETRATRYEGWSAHFASSSIEQLIEAFNREVGNEGWGTARADYLHALRLAFEACGYDCSSFISLTDGAMSLRCRLALDGGRVVPRG